MIGHVKVRYADLFVCFRVLLAAPAEMTVSLLGTDPCIKTLVIVIFSMPLNTAPHGGKA